MSNSTEGGDYGESNSGVKRVEQITHVEHLSQPFFNNVRDGLKIFEGRLNKGKFAKGDRIVWYNDDCSNDLNSGNKLSRQECSTQVISTMIFKSFEEAIIAVGLKNILPSEAIDSDIKTAVNNTYRKFYSIDREIELGVIILHLAPIFNE